MSDKVTEKDLVSYGSGDMLHSAQSLIAVSSIIQATSDQYAHTGQLSVGALIHAGNVIDNVIERLGLADLAVEQSELPF